MNTQPYIDAGCNRCPANSHEFPFYNSRSVFGICGDSNLQGSCYGLIFVQYRNHSRQVLANVSKHIGNLQQRGRA